MVVAILWFKYVKLFYFTGMRFLCIACQISGLVIHEGGATFKFQSIIKGIPYVSITLSVWLCFWNMISADQKKGNAHPSPALTPATN
jgi:hypothetical protein